MKLIATNEAAELSATLPHITVADATLSDWFEAVRAAHGPVDGHLIMGEVQS